MTVINFDDHFRNRMGEVDRGHIEVFPKLCNLRQHDKTNGEITRIPRLMTAYHEVREETKGLGDYKKLPDFPLIRRMLLGAVSAVQTPRLGAFETNERRMAKFSEMRIRVSLAETLQCCSIRSLLTLIKQRGDE